MAISYESNNSSAEREFRLKELEKVKERLEVEMSCIQPTRRLSDLSAKLAAVLNDIKRLK